MKRILKLLYNILHLNRWICIVEAQNQRLDALEHHSRNNVDTMNALRHQNDQRLDALEYHSRNLDIQINTIIKKVVAEQIFYQAAGMHQRIDQFLFDCEQESRVSESLSSSASLMMDDYYVAFENAFRGSRSAIQKNYSAYIELLEMDTVSKALDIGCGRGEWIQLLQQKGIEAHGVDANSTMISLCEEEGIQHVTCKDAITYLKECDNESFDFISAFHLIEHLPLEITLLLLAQIMRVLKPQGKLVIETPNPDNLLVSSLTFYNDPTHRNPIPKEVAKFLCEYAGFKEIESISLHPFPKEMHFKEDSEVTHVLNERFFGGQDYIVIGIKP
jgi:O-antigen chain-terminating methyltransferase